MPAVPGEDFLGLPGLEHQGERFAVTLALLDRHDTIRDGGIGRQSGREARNQPPAADAVKHGVFLGDARWRTGRGQCGAELDDRDVLAVRELGQHRAHQARIGHETVDVLMVLIGAQSVHPGARCMDEFIQCPVVVLAHLVRVCDIEPDRIDIGGLVALAEITRQVAIGHQMEHADFHGSTLVPDGRRRITARGLMIRSITFAPPASARSMADVNDPYFIIADAIIEPIRIVRCAHASKFRRAINDDANVWRERESSRRLLNGAFDSDRGSRIARIKIREDRFQIGTRARRVPNSHRCRL